MPLETISAPVHFCALGLIAVTVDVSLAVALHCDDAVGPSDSDGPQAVTGMFFSFFCVLKLLLTLTTDIHLRTEALAVVVVAESVLLLKPRAIMLFETQRLYLRDLNLYQKGRIYIYIYL